MASARNLVTTRCSLPCRPMRWYGPVHGSPPTSHLFLRVLDPSFSCVGICFGSGRFTKSALAYFLLLASALYLFFSFLSTQVDKHIRRLDTDLARFEADLKEKQIESSDYDSSSSKGKKSRTQKEKKAARARSKGKNSDEEAPKAAQKKLKLVRPSPEYGMPSVTFGSVHPSDVLDMPVDPNEPTYCLCHQVSYGEMIGCDNPDCSIEWFHFACVGLTTKPRGKWFCPRCSQERKKK
uniref:Inhibitor of growth family member 4 n=1 Tax=Molossus molossus TaxID=27622 RepID=A0A7J8FY53_MOLMO|nr:inhibitor of growth family member 4 [Molossus molossus]